MPGFGCTTWVSFCPPVSGQQPLHSIKETGKGQLSETNFLPQLAPASPSSQGPGSLARWERHPFHPEGVWRVALSAQRAAWTSSTGLFGQVPLPALLGGFRGGLMAPAGTPQNPSRNKYHTCGWNPSICRKRNETTC